MDPVNEQAATGPSVTYAEVTAAICDETYTVLPNGRTTVCQLTLDNGFTVEGQSACVSLENFDAVKGNKAAKDRALDQVWQLLGFRLADRLKREREPDASSPELAGGTWPVAEEVGQNPSTIRLGDQVMYFEKVGTKVSEPMLALVTSVLSHDHMALSVFAPNGTQHARQDVVLIAAGSVTPDMPFFARPKNA